jgi:two-component system, LytTR family, sensor histidine kinase AlgZ
MSLLNIPFKQEKGKQERPKQERRDEVRNPFLPELCSSQAVFMLVLIAELLALLLTISDSSGLRRFSWDRLALVSVQIQWIVVFSAIMLCRLRFWLTALRPLVAGSLSYGLVLAVTLLVSSLGQWVIYVASGMAFSADQPFAFDLWQLANAMAISAIVSGIFLRYLYLQQQLRNQQQAETQARIQALQSRIRPHFLFNSMNSIASLIAVDPTTAERVVEDLSELFRASLAEPTLIPLERELSLCQHYLDIEKLRLGDRLVLDWRVNLVNSQVKIPSLILQPLLENAIFHGVEPLSGGGLVTVTVEQNDKQVKITIINPFVAGAKKLERQSSSERLNNAERHNRMALDNIRLRLAAHFGNEATLTIQTDNHLFNTCIIIPNHPLI